MNLFIDFFVVKVLTKCIFVPKFSLIIKITSASD